VAVIEGRFRRSVENIRDASIDSTRSILLLSQPGVPGSAEPLLTAERRGK
jgi:hypothetical protein